MTIDICARGRRRSVGLALVLGGLVAGCAPRVEAPAPVVSGGVVERSPARVTVERGQTLSEIAHAYHVPMRVIAEANGLAPPYRIQAGRTLLIPRDRQANPAESVASLPAPASGPAAPTAPQPGRQTLVPPDSPPVTAGPLPPVTSPGTAPGGIAPPPANPVPPPPQAASEPPPAPQEAPGRSGMENAMPPAAHPSGAFLWPVHGRILASYGSRGDGTHNDGINIGAPKGTPVEAADAGVVAYTGNELRGYGNLILVKHASGWISAYAHCDQILVNRGEKVARGQVIARVGSTGSVGEPQLHFELRQGHKAVDPRDFLAPLPVAATKDARPS